MIKKRPCPCSEAIKQVHPGDNICSEDWTATSDLTCARCYDQMLIKPLCAETGNDAQTVMEDLCNRYWNNDYIIKNTLPRFTHPTPGAFDLFRKAGMSDVFKNDKTIALTELKLWKKVHKLKQFKKDYPQRYQLAID